MDYNEFRSDWIQKHKNSIPVKEKGNLNSIWSKIGWFVIFFAAAIISSVHTIPAIIDTIPDSVDGRVIGIAGIAGFMAIEAVLFASAASREKTIWTKLALWLAIAVAISGNIYSGLEAVNETVNGVSSVISNPFSLFLALMLGFTIPLIAFASGEQYNKLSQQDYVENQRVKSEHQAALKAIDAQINSAYSRYTQNRSSTPRNASTGHSDNDATMTQAQVVDFLRRNPEKYEQLQNGTLKSSDLATELNTHRSTITKAKQQLEAG